MLSHQQRATVIVRKNEMGHWVKVLARLGGLISDQSLPTAVQDVHDEFATLLLNDQISSDGDYFTILFDHCFVSPQ